MRNPRLAGGGSFGSSPKGFVNEAALKGFQDSGNCRD